MSDGIRYAGEMLFLDTPVSPNQDLFLKEIKMQDQGSTLPRLTSIANHLRECRERVNRVKELTIVFENTLFGSTPQTTGPGEELLDPNGVLDSLESIIADLTSTIADIDIKLTRIMRDTVGDQDG